MVMLLVMQQGKALTHPPQMQEKTSSQSIMELD